MTKKSFSEAKIAKAQVLIKAGMRITLPPELLYAVVVWCLCKGTTSLNLAKDPEHLMALNSVIDLLIDKQVHLTNVTVFLFELII